MARHGRIVYYITEKDGKKVRVRQRRGLYFIVRRHVRAAVARSGAIDHVRAFGSWCCAVPRIMFCPFVTAARALVRGGMAGMRAMYRRCTAACAHAVSYMRGMSAQRFSRSDGANGEAEDTRVVQSDDHKHGHRAARDAREEESLSRVQAHARAASAAVDSVDDRAAVGGFVRRSFASLWRILRAILWALADVVLLVIAALVLIAIYVYFTTPDVAQMVAPGRIAQTSVIYDRTGTVVLYEVHGEENRKSVPHDAIPDVVRRATIAAEDDAFYTHFGIDPFSIARAVKENFLRNTLAQGGSTITQQLARNVFLSREKTLKRKVREAVMALKIERAFTKDEILDMYLNVIPYGANAYGIEAAAETYFGKRALDLTLDEAALLAALPKAPTTFSPYGTHTNRLLARQKMILERMRELGLAPQPDIDRALEVDTLTKIRPLRTPIRAPHFVFAVLEDLERRYGRTMVERGGLHVITTLDMALQHTAEDVVARSIPHVQRWGASNVALVAVEPRSGAVRAMVGSKDYYAQDIDGQVNVTTRLRQPGSAFKPFAYAAAFAKGYQPETLVWDVLTDFGPDGTGKRYMPRNYSGRFHGAVSLRDALAQSLNVPAVKVLYLAGIDPTIDLATAMGITTLTQRDRYGLALVLGGAEVRPVEMAGAYAVFANDGVRAPQHMIARVTNSAGDVLFDAARDIAPRRVLAADVARKINAVLSDANARIHAFGRNNALTVPGRTAAAKTGTTQNFRDAWTVGYTPSLSVAVWVGNNDNRPMRPGASGGTVAAPVWREFMMHALKDAPVERFTPYTPVATTIPMLGGRLVGTRVAEPAVVGAKAKKKDRRKQTTRVVYHTILHYVVKDDPLSGGTPNYRDVMYRRWEASLARALTPTR